MNSSGFCAKYFIHPIWNAKYKIIAMFYDENKTTATFMAAAKTMTEKVNTIPATL